MTRDLTNIIVHAYNIGLLQYDPMVICGITITMNMFTHHNMITLQKNNVLLSVSVYDSDSSDVQESTIENLISDFLTKI